MLQTKEEVVEEKSGIGVIVARFQVPSLTIGHKELIQTVIDRHDQTIIVLGLSHIKATKNNPLDYETRRRMIQEEFGDEIKILYQKDNKYNDVWSSELDKLIYSNVPPGAKITLYGSRDSFISHYQGKIKTKELIPNTIINGTKQREKVALSIPNSLDYRKGVIWATQNQYDVAYPAVDIAIYNRKTDLLLLGKKDFEKEYRFIGGFCDPKKVNQEGFLEANAKRELFEEVGQIEVTKPKYITSFFVDDWRYRGETSKIFTSLFIVEYLFGQPIPNDDISELKWFSVEHLEKDNSIVVNEHKMLLEATLNYIKSHNQLNS